jgi:hypothetical protein
MVIEWFRCYRSFTTRYGYVARGTGFLYAARVRFKLKTAETISCLAKVCRRPRRGGVKLLKSISDSIPEREPEMALFLLYLLILS